MTEFARGGIFPADHWCECPTERHLVMADTGRAFCETVQVHQPDCPRRAPETT